MTTRSLSSPKSVVRSQTRAVLLVDVALRAQPLDGALDRAGLVQRVLVEVDVEVDAEVVQRGLDLAEHQLDALAAEDLLRVVLRSSASGTSASTRAAISSM